MNNISSWDIDRKDLVRNLQEQAAKPGIAASRVADDLQTLDGYAGECVGDISRSVEQKVTSDAKSEKAWSLGRLASGALVLGGTAALAIVGAPVAAGLVIAGAVGAGVSQANKTSALRKVKAGRSFNERLWNHANQVAGKASVPVPQDGPEARFQEKYGPWALVTGASSGIGAEFARQLAAKGLNVVLVARHKENLDRAAEALVKDYGVQVKTVAVDLADRNCLQPLKEATQGLQVGLLVNDAGTWQEGPLLQTDLSKQLEVVDLNMRAPMMLSHEFGRLMADRGTGGIINVGSTLGYNPSPFHANYAATKTFAISLSEGLVAEMAPHGIDVLAVSPGPTLTPGTRNAPMDRIPLPKSTPEQVVTSALAALGNKHRNIPGAMNYLSAVVANTVLPRSTITAIAGTVAQHILSTDAGQVILKPDSGPTEKT